MNIIVSLLLVYVSVSACRQNNISGHYDSRNLIYVDSLKGDFNQDGKMDIARAARQDKHLIFEIFDKTPTIHHRLFKEPDF